MNKDVALDIKNKLKELIPNPKCELVYHNLFELLVAVMLSSQTTDKRVNQITPNLFAKYPNPKVLSEANFDELYLLIKPLGFANNKAKNLIAMAKMLHSEYQDIVPTTLEALEKLNGVGHKTASVVLVEGYKIPAMPVDTHILRVAKRLGYVPMTADVVQTEEALKACYEERTWGEIHHLLLLFGRYHCKAINPSCQNCMLKKYCQTEEK